MNSIAIMSSLCHGCCVASKELGIIIFIFTAYCEGDLDESGISVDAQDRVSISLHL